MKLIKCLMFTFAIIGAISFTSINACDDIRWVQYFSASDNMLLTLEIPELLRVNCSGANCQPMNDNNNKQKIEQVNLWAYDQAESHGLFIPRTDFNDSYQGNWIALNQNVPKWQQWGLGFCSFKPTLVIVPKQPPIILPEEQPTQAGPGYANSDR